MTRHVEKPREAQVEGGMYTVYERQTEEAQTRGPISEQPREEGRRGYRSRRVRPGRPLQNIHDLNNFYTAQAHGLNPSPLSCFHMSKAWKNKL